MRGVGFFGGMIAAVLIAAAPAQASSCSNPGAMGLSRTITIDPLEYPRLGLTTYSQTLPLADHEVVLTFDDGPIRPYTEAVLRELAAQCLKATFFMVGRQAEANPDMVRAIAQAGHTIGTHSQNHPLAFDQMTIERARSEIDDGIASVSNALGDPRALAPFFRIPGLLKSPQVESELAARGISLWSTDFDADDWYRAATPEDIVTKAMHRLETKGRGILLLHDVQPATALALPMLLQQLRAHGYRIVHVVPKAKKMAPVAAGSSARGKSAAAAVKTTHRSDPFGPPFTASTARTSKGWTVNMPATAYAPRERRSARPVIVERRYTSDRRAPEVHDVRRDRRARPYVADGGWTTYRR